MKRHNLNLIIHTWIHSHSLLQCSQKTAFLQCYLCQRLLPGHSEIQHQAYGTYHSMHNFTQTTPSWYCSAFLFASYVHGNVMFSQPCMPTQWKSCFPTTKSKHFLEVGWTEIPNTYHGANQFWNNVKGRRKKLLRSGSQLWIWRVE